MGMFGAFTAVAGGLSVGEPDVRWDHRKVRVCWAEADAPYHFTEELRTGVQEIISREYRLERTGIEFTGWRSCSLLSPNQYDAVLIQSTKSHSRFFKVFGHASIGQSTEERPHVYLYYENQSANGFKLTGIENLQLTALHEFGHLAGLRHEHAREEAKSLEVPSCAGDETVPGSAHEYGPYDRTSVMNDCWLEQLRLKGTSFSIATRDLPRIPRYLRGSGLLSVHQMGEISRLEIAIGLSHGDVATLREMYR
ncbi:MAG: hypothetical protein EBX52_04495 [Proteobacteria bacterium]|nr:hypothetical protein [Pseudomonadota bacterium]